MSTCTACTSKACEWNNVCVKTVEAARVKDIMFYSSEAKEKLKRVTPPPPRPSSPEEQNVLLGLLAATGEKLVGLSTFCQYVQQYTTPAPPATSWQP